MGSDTSCLCFSYDGQLLASRGGKSESLLCMDVKGITAEALVQDHLDEDQLAEYEAFQPGLTSYQDLMSLRAVPF